MTDRFPLNETIAILGRAACDAEIHAADETLSFGTRDGFRSLAGKLRDLQVETLGEYQLANVLNERKYVSHVTRGAWFGLCHALIIVALAALVALAIWKGGL